MNARLRWALPLTVLVSFLLLLLITKGAATKTQSQTETENHKATISQAEAEQVAPPSDPVSSSEEAKTLKYWTKERMKEAKPVKPVKPVVPGRPESPPGDVPRPEGPAKTIPPSAPEQMPRVPSAQLSAPESTATATTSTYPYAYTREAVPTSYYNYYPYSTFGKVFFVENGQDQVCSGTVVNSINKSIVWTAGHCVHGGAGAGYATKWIFVPAYKDGTAPYGTWTAQTLRTTRGWADSSNFSYDLGAAVVGRNASGQLVANRVGAMGITWNQAYEQTWRSLGYPAEYPFDGRWMYVCLAQTAVYDDSNGSPYTMGIGCDMTGGASGGGWTIGLSGSGGTVASVNSYKYDHQPQAMYGPYHGTAASNLYAAVRNVYVCCMN